MFDTVKFRLSLTRWSPTIPSEWSYTGNTHINPTNIKSTRRLTHKASGLRIYGTATDAQWLEVSLPRLFFGKNGCLLRPEDINPALTKLQHYLRQVAPGAQLMDLTRVDLTCHFRGSARRWFAGFRLIKHPKIRTLPIDYYGETLFWEGKQVKIRLYKKGEDCNGTDILRLEFQLHGRSKVPAVWNGSTLDFETAYQFYRRLALQFPKRSVPKLSTSNQLCAWLLAENVTANQMCPTEVLLANLSLRQAQRTRKQIASAVFQREKIDFEQLLPANDYPLWIDAAVRPPGSAIERLHALKAARQQAKPHLAHSIIS